MAFTNPETKEINCKILYLGPEGSGKTSNLRSIYTKTSAELRSGLFELEADEGTSFFECLPVSLGFVKDYQLKFNLYALPRHKLYDSLTSVIVKGMDGYVFVNDARAEALADNIMTMQETRRLLLAEGVSIAELPKVVQYNKTDLAGTVPLEILRQELNPAGVPDFSTVATASIGTMECLQAMVKLILKQLAP